MYCEMYMAFDNVVYFFTKLMWQISKAQLPNVLEDC